MIRIMWAIIFACFLIAFWRIVTGRTG